MIQELAVEQLRYTFDPALLGIETTENLKPLEGIIGQRRAVSALQFGLGIHDVGFNIFVAGPPGIGKMTAVQSFLDQVACLKATPPDWCYVNNFEDPYQPKVIALPTGRGRRLQQDLATLIADARREIPKAFESDEYNAKRDEITNELNVEREALLNQLRGRAAQSGFALEPTPFGIATIPVRHGRPLNEAEFQELPETTRAEIQQHHEALQKELRAMMKQLRARERASREKLQELDKQVALYVVGGLIEDLGERYGDLPEVTAFIAAAQKDIFENIETFKTGKSADTPQPADDAPLPSPWLRDLPFHKYQVNVLVDNSTRQGAPVILELNPNFNNLFGRIEKETHFGALYTDLTMIKAGSLHQANGGYLVVAIEDLLRNPYSWEGLKRALRSKEVQIEDLSDRLGYLTVKSLRPQPLPLDVKVVIIGRPMLYYLLHAYDEEFSELFKVKVDFDSRMARSAENIQDFTAFICTLCQKEKLKHLDASAVAKLLEHAARLAEDQERLSTHFGAVADVIREAHFWATQDNAAFIGAAHVRKALDEKVHRSNLLQERMQEMITRGALLIETTGESIGQVNGLSVLSLGDYLFGKPSRITACVGPGRAGILDIEREVELGGPIHSKGVLILSGYLAQKYAQDQPLTLDARLVFEQSYEGVEGDSASSAELYALLSALAEKPLEQGIAVTGSVNQYGEVQAIGGVNEKIEGFFDVCRARGLTGAQGVIIPQSNAQNLMLRPDVIEAVRAQQFHVWAVSTIDEGIEILVGIPAGTRAADGKFAAGTLNYLVAERLRAFAATLKEFAVYKNS